MLQGVSRTARKRHNKAAPNFLQGVISRARKRHTLSTLKGSMSRAQKCHIRIDPTSFIWCREIIAAMPIQKRTKGRVMEGAQKCQPPHALPIQFNGASYPARKRHRFVAPRGRVIWGAQKCQPPHALPSQFTGDTDMTQQCLDHNSPRERSHSARRNAVFGSPLPTSYRGPIFHRRNAKS